MTAALDPLVAVIDERVRRAVDERLAELGLAPEYTSECRPASVSRRAFNTACRSGKISGAMKDGKTWRCSRIAWNEGRTRVPLKREEVAPPMTNAQRAQKFLRAAGVRPAAGGRS